MQSHCCTGSDRSGATTTRAPSSSTSGATSTTPAPSRRSAHPSLLALAISLAQISTLNPQHGTRRSQPRIKKPTSASGVWPTILKLTCFSGHPTTCGCGGPRNLTGDEGLVMWCIHMQPSRHGVLSRVSGVACTVQGVGVGIEDSHLVHPHAARPQNLVHPRGGTRDLTGWRAS